MALFNNTSGHKWASAMVAKQAGQYATYGPGVTRSACNCRPETGRPCKIHIEKLNKTNISCRECGVRLGLPSKLTPEQVDALYDQAVEDLAKDNTAPVKINRNALRATKKILRMHKEPAKCAFPGCENLTYLEYCPKCARTIAHRKHSRVPREFWHVPTGQLRAARRAAAAAEKSAK